jgi:hypothetical protein
MRTLSECYDFIRALAHQEPWSEDIDIMLVHCRNGQRRAVCKPLVFEDIPDTALVQPTFRLYRHEAQELIDMLWNCGLRPTQGKSSAGQLDAVERHLADMRAVAFTKLEIKQP